MNKNLIIITLLVIFGCNRPDKKIIGRWIEKDNFKNPIEYKFNEFTYIQKTGGLKSEQLYHIQKDTLFINGFVELLKLRIKFHGDFFSLYDIKNDTLIATFEKLGTNNFIDYFNIKKNTTVELPEINALKIDHSPWDRNIIVADLINNQMQLYFNGELHSLTDTSFINILNSRDSEYETIENWLYLDKNLPVSDIRKIKREIQLAQLKLLAFVVSNNGKQSFIKVLMPSTEYSYPSSIKTIIPPLPPPVVWDFENENFPENNCLCYISDTLCLFNSKNLSIDNLLDSVKIKLTNNPQTMLHVYFNDNLTCEDYLKSLFEIQSIYFKIRSEIAIDKFGTDDLENLNYQDLDEIKDDHPMRIREIDNNEYNKLIKYAL